MIKDLSKLKVGDKVYYQPEHYAEDEFENGIVKEIPAFAFKPENQVGYDCVRVVYNCGGKWDKYYNYTSALTHKRDLFIGWK